MSAAFPTAIAVGPAGDVFTSDDFAEGAGMTLRDYFAAKAMVAFMSSPRFLDGLDKMCVESKVDLADGFAATCYRYADAMLKAKERA